MYIVKVKTFLEWYFSDDNSEGVTITDDAVNNLSDKQMKYIDNLLKTCKLIPCRLVENDTSNGEDYKVEKVILIK